MRVRKTALFLLLSGFSSLLFARFCAAQEADERGQLAFRMGDKYEMYVAEKKLPAAVMRKYTYIIEGREAGYDTVYLCSDFQTATTYLAGFLDRLKKIEGGADEQVFNAMDMRLYTLRNNAYVNEVLFMHYQKTWRVSYSNTLLLNKKELSSFRQQYEYF